MLSSSGWKEGLTFLEFNYMLMQAYDFLELNRRYGCKLEMGGDDQWSNILAGADLIRRKEQQRRLWPDLHASHQQRRQEDGQDGKRRPLAGRRKRHRLMNFISTGEMWRMRTWSDVCRC